LTACCGGFDDLDAARAGGSGIGSTVTKPNEPANPEIQTNWRYSSTEIDGTVFSVTANNTAISSFNDPITNTRRTPRVQLERQLINNLSTESVTIVVGSTLPCLPSCDVRIRFDGQLTIYRMQSSGDGIVKPADRNTESTLFKKFTTSNRAVVSLPIVGLGNTFDAEFDLRNYDPNRMTL
jgi:hypothetical protein